MTEFHSKKFGDALRTGLLRSVESLFDARMAWMQDEIRDGWRCFYARELWFKENLPEPLINENGRKYEVDKLRARINQSQGDPRWVASPVMAIVDYRNYLDPGPLDVCERDGKPGPRDLVANSVTEQLLEIENRHFWFEVRKNEQRWLEEVTDRARLSAHLPRIPSSRESSPLRDNAILLERDAKYWSALYQLERRDVDEAVVTGFEKTAVEFMRHLAPDFPFHAHVNKYPTLIFAPPTSTPVQWAILFDPMEGNIGGLFDFPPRLVLLDAEVLRTEKRRKLTPADILFCDVIGSPRLMLYEARDLELGLRFTLQRLRRAMDFYDQFVAQALQESL